MAVIIKSMHRSLLLIVSLMFFSFVPVVSAHHGFAAHYYPDKIIRIEGTVRKFVFINPHSILHIDSVNEAGEPVVYVCDLQARSQLIRLGADESLFTVGEPIVVEGFAARRDPLRCEFGTGYFADGGSFTMRSTDGARSLFPENRAAPLAPGASRTIFGVWIRPDIYGDAGGRGKETGYDSITAEGKAARAAFDPDTDNPVYRCEGSSPVRVWRSPGLATSIRRQNNDIIIYHEYMDITRTVHMNMREHPADIQPSYLGHSIGRFEDGYLVIDTAAYTSGMLFMSTLHTDQMTIEERISIQLGTGDLLISWTVNEPVYYSEPLTGSQRLKSTDKEIIPYDCVPELPPE